MAIGSVKDSGASRGGSHQWLDGIIDQPSCDERTEWPGDGTPEGGRPLLGVCGTPSQLSCSVALAF